MGQGNLSHELPPTDLNTDLRASQKKKRQQSPMEAMKTHRQLQKQSMRIPKGCLAVRQL